MSDQKPAAILTGLDYETGGELRIELNDEQWEHFMKCMSEDREPTPAMRRAAYRHQAMVKARKEGRLSIDTMQEIFAEADREFDKRNAQAREQEKP